MAQDDTNEESVSESFRKLLRDTHGVGPKTIDNFAEAELYEIDDIDELLPTEVEERVDGVGAKTAHRIFQSLQDGEHTDYVDIQAEVDFTAVDEDFPDHVRGLINAANETAQSTRPSNVGQMSELFDRDKFESIEDWKEWYLTTEHSDGLKESLEGKTGEELVDRATDSTWEMIQTHQEKIKQIDRDMVERWIKELVLSKTPEGLVKEKKAIEYLADEHDMKIADSTPSEESKGIDGYLDGQEVSVKSAKYQGSGRREAIEKLDHPMIWYRLEDTGEDSDDEGEETRRLTIYYNSEKLGLNE